MAFINWTDDFKTGNQTIDDQHRGLVETVNKFDDAACKGKGSRIMNEILTELIDYTAEHFTCEEGIMEEAGYQKLKLHKSQHQQLLERVEKFQFEFNNNGKRITKDLREFLKYWLTNHILKEDKDFANSTAVKS